MTAPNSSYEVHVETGLIVFDVVGPQPLEAVKAMRQAAEEVLARKHAPKDLLVLQKGGVDSFNLEAFQATAASLQEVPFRRLAVVATSPTRIGLTHTLFKEASGNDHERFKIFRDEKLARAWLESESHPLRTKLKSKTQHLRPKKD